jgi:hypothetical protein
MTFVRVVTKNSDAAVVVKKYFAFVVADTVIYYYSIFVGLLEKSVETIVT